MKRPFGWFIGSVVLGILATPRVASAQLALSDGWLASHTNERGQHCEQREVRTEPDRILVACGAAGVWVVVLAEGELRLSASYEFPGEAVGFMSAADGGTWVKLQLLEARPLPATAAAPAPVAPRHEASFPETDRGPVITPAPAPPPPAEVRAPLKSAAAHAGVGKVVKPLPGGAIISLGTEDGIQRGQHIEFSLENAEDGTESEDFVLRDTVAVGVVTNVTDHSAKVRLGVNEDVPLGARASVTNAPSTASLSGPPRAEDIWQISAMARPFAALSELGGGALLSADLGIRTKHLHVSATLDPLAFATVSGKSGVVSSSGVISLAYDSQYFEMGLGLGAQTVNEPAFGVDAGSGLTLAQVIRIGALDGTSIMARTSVALFRSELMFGGMVAEARFHVTRGYWLQLAGGGGAVGYGYGEIGLRALLSGNGLAGSSYLTVTAGGAGVFKAAQCPPFDFCTSSVSYGGPMAGVGGEWRF